MTKLFLVFLIGLLFLAPLHPAHPHAVNGVENHNVDIPNAALRGIIEDRLNKAAGDPITANEIAGGEKIRGLDEVVKDSPDINSLTGLEHATNLVRVDIGRNRIRHPPSSRTTANTLSDLSPLTNLSKLSNLSLNTHRITDLSPLATLSALEDLVLTSNSELADLSPLQDLTSLKRVYVDRCNITDITAIGTLTNLQVLRIGVNWNLRDISPLANLSTLRDLRMNSTAITQEGLSAVLPALEGAREPVSGIQYWASLDITNTEISDLSVLDKIPDGVFMHNLYLQYMGTSATGTRFFLLKDLTPLVELMNKGKVVSADTSIRLNWNFRLDYASLYEDIPTLLETVRRVEYLESTPSLVKESPTSDNYKGNSGSRATFVVRAVNDTPYSTYPLERTQNRTFNEVPVTWKVTAPDGTVTENIVPTGEDGLSSWTITLGADGEKHTIEAIVPAKSSAAGPSHDELKVTFTATAVAPPVITLTLDEGSVTQTSLQWIADITGTLPQAYQHYYKKSADSAWIKHVKLGRLPRRFSYVHLDLEPGTSYDFQLFALRGESQIEPGSNVLTASTLSRTPPGPRPPEPPPEPPAPVNHPPVFRSTSSVNVAEDTTAVVTIIAEDPDAEDEITGYAITGGADAALFEIGGASTPANMLRFKTAPDFEMPGSAANSNVYTLILTATSGVGDRELTATQTLIVTVTDVDEPVDPPVDPPIDPPVEPPVDPPEKPPVEQPPVDPPVELPVEPPVEPSVEPSVVGGGAPRPPIPLSTQTLIFNEIGNLSVDTSDDTNDWVELKNVCNTPLDLSEWQIRLITTENVASGAEIDVVSLPDFVLPAQGVLLVANTDPSENHLASGLNIATGARESGAQHLYFVAPDLKLPNTPFLLILQRMALTDEDPTIADVAGNYFWPVLSYGSEVYPFVYPISETVALYPTEETVPLTNFGAWQRQRLEQPGYLAAAWIPSGYHAHLGYDRHAPASMCLGTPGYLRDPSPVLPVVSRVVFNKIRNASDNTNDYIELKNVCDMNVRLRDWEISIVTSTGEYVDQDVDIVSFPDYTLPTQGLLLITNTDPSETWLSNGLNIAANEQETDARHPYFVAPDLKLPDTPFLLILRHAREKNGTPESIEDVAGSYFRNTVDNNMGVWPLADTHRPSAPIVQLNWVGAWQRKDIRERGYLAAAWTEIQPQYDLIASATLPLVSRVIFSKVRNASDDTNDYIELKNVRGTDVQLRDWEISIVASTGKYADQDVDIASFPDYTLSVGGVLLITNTDPDETVMIDGLNITQGAKRKQGAHHPYLVASDLKLPSTPYLLILRHARNRNGTPESIEDVAGNYFRSTVDNDKSTEVWPLADTRRPSASAAPLSEVGNWQRKDTTEHGYLATAWTVNQSPPGIGSAPNALEDGQNALFAPNANAAAVVFNPTLPDEVRITELMSETKGDTLPQWIELYNASQTPVDLKGWQLAVETRTNGAHLHAHLVLKSFSLPPKRTGLLVTEQGESSDALPTDRVYDLSEAHPDVFRRHLKNILIGTEGFSLKLLHPTGRVVDSCGNLDGDKNTDDQPTWTLPDSKTLQGHRFSLLRRFDGDVLKGTKATGWMSTVSVAIGVNAYYGHPTDIATPLFLHQIVPGTSPTVTLSISEIMFETNTRTRPLPQWIELYNPSFTHAVKLKDYQLVIETLQEGKHQHIIMTLEAFDVLPNQTALLVTGRGQHSKHLPANRTYNLSERHPKAFLSLPNRYRLLTSEGFLIQLTDATGNAVDTIGNLDGYPHTKDTPAWTLPLGETNDGARASLRRLYEKQRPLDGRLATAWVSTADVPPKIITYYGHASDVGNPMYRKGTPLPVTLSSFKATRTPDGVVINWTTESELDNAGFYIYRSETKDGDFKVINETMIQGAGTTGERNEYTWTDTTAKPNTVYYYQIEDVSHAGVHQTLTTTRLRGLISAKGKMVTQWASFKKGR